MVSAESTINFFLCTATLTSIMDWSVTTPLGDSDIHYYYVKKFALQSWERVDALSKVPNSTMPTHRKKEDKAGRLKRREQHRSTKKH